MSGMDCYYCTNNSTVSIINARMYRKIFNKEYISPFIAISLEGISGFVIVSGLIPSMSLISCSTSYIMCNEEKVSSSFNTIFKDIFEQEYILRINMNVIQLDR